MKKPSMLKRRAVVALALVLLVVGTGAALATGAYGLPWFTFDGGGGSSAGGSYRLSGTIGQPDAGLLQGGDYQL